MRKDSLGSKWIFNTSVSGAGFAILEFESYKILTVSKISFTLNKLFVDVIIYMYIIIICKKNKM